MTSQFEYDTFNNDDIQRKPIAENIIRLLQNDHLDISPLMINGNWGTGKTTFCKRLINLFETEYSELPGAAELVYVDAYAEDHLDEPLVSLMAAVAQRFPNKKKDFLKKVMPLLRFGLSTGLKLSLAYGLGQSAEEFQHIYKKGLQKAGDKGIDDALNALINERMEREQNMSTFKEALQTLRGTKNIILFIDELDRCRPTYAMAMLEVVKHVFEEGGVKVVLVTNREQLLASIEHGYGARIDAERYLDKFVKFSFELSNTFFDDNKNEKKASWQHFEGLLESSALLQESVLKDPQVSEFLQYLLLECRDTSLREVNSFFRYLEILQVLDDKTLHPPKTYGLEYDVGPMMPVFGVFLFVFHPALAYKVAKNAFECEAVLSVLGAKIEELKLPKSEEKNLRLPTRIDVVVTLVCTLAEKIDNRSHKKFTKFLVGDRDAVALKSWRELVDAGTDTSGKKYYARVGEIINKLRLTH